MTMTKMLLTTHWTPVEVHNMLDFLSELQEVIKTNYAEELEEFYREIYVDHRHDRFDFIDDEIPF